MPAPTMEAPASAPAPTPEADGMAEQPIEGQLSLDPQIAENEAAEREIARTGIKAEVGGLSYDEITGNKPWQSLSKENQAVFAGLARKDNPKLFDRNEDRAQARFLRKIRSEMSAESLAEWKADKQAAKAEKAEAKRATLEDLEPKERFSRLRKGYGSLKAAYQERRAKKAESKGSEAQAAPEETPDSRLEELIAKGMDERTANTVIDVANRIAAYKKNPDKTEKQARRYALDVTRRAALGQFNVSKLADSQEAMEALVALRKEVDFVQNGAEATEPAELDVLVAEQQKDIEAEVIDFEGRKLAERLGVAAMAAVIGGTGVGVVTAETLGDSSPAAAVEVADETNQADNSTFTTASGETFRINLDQVRAPNAAALESLMGLPGTELKDAVAAAEADDDTPGAVTVAGEQVDASQDTEQAVAGVYKVKKGDNLSDIVEERLGPEASNANTVAEVQRVAELNKLPDPDLIYPDQELKF